MSVRMSHCTGWMHVVWITAPQRCAWQKQNNKQKQKKSVPSLKLILLLTGEYRNCGAFETRSNGHTFVGLFITNSQPTQAQLDSSVVVATKIRVSASCLLIGQITIVTGLLRKIPFPHFFPSIIHLMVSIYLLMSHPLFSRVVCVCVCVCVCVRARARRAL